MRITNVWGLARGDHNASVGPALTDGPSKLKSVYGPRHLYVGYNDAQIRFRLKQDERRVSVTRCHRSIASVFDRYRLEQPNGWLVFNNQNRGARTTHVPHAFYVAHIKDKFLKLTKVVRRAFPHTRKIPIHLQHPA